MGVALQVAVVVLEHPQPESCVATAAITRVPRTRERRGVFSDDLVRSVSESLFLLMSGPLVLFSGHRLVETDRLST